MIQGMAKLSVIVVMLAVLTHLQATACQGWTLNPFASAESEDTKPKKTTVKPTTPPSTWDRVTVGTKDFFNKTGETLGLKKPEPKKPARMAMAVPRQPKLQPRRKTEPKPWYSAMFGAEEREEPKNVGEWMGSTRRMDP